VGELRVVKKREENGKRIERPTFNVQRRIEEEMTNNEKSPSPVRRQTLPPVGHPKKEI
jgi:hypothetical protein